MPTLNSSFASQGLPHTSARLNRAKRLRDRVEEKSQQVASCDESSIDLDARSGQVRIESTIPKPSAFGRYFSTQNEVNASVSFDLKTNKVDSAVIEDVQYNYFENKERFEKTTLSDGAVRYDRTEVYRQREILDESYTFNPDGTIVLHNIPPFVDSPCPCG